MKYIAVTADKTLKIATAEQPAFHHNECLVKVKSIGVNRADILQKQGKYPPPKGESEILGLEVAGEIVDSGDAVHQWQPGDKVFGLVPGGAYAEYVKVKANHLMPLPENLSFEQGAAIAEVFLTAYQSLFTLGQLKSGESVLIHAGASGVGTAAIQLAKAIGCKVLVTVGTDEKARACLALGADQAINYKDADFALWAKQHRPQGFDLILDVVAGDYLNKNISVAALDGRIIMLAMLGGRFSEPVDCAKMLMKRIRIQASTLRNRSDEYKEALVENFRQTFFDKLQNESIFPVIDKVFDWQEASQAHHLLERNANIGKLVLKVK